MSRWLGDWVGAARRVVLGVIVPAGDNADGFGSRGGEFGALVSAVGHLRSRHLPYRFQIGRRLRLGVVVVCPLTMLGLGVSMSLGTGAGVAHKLVGVLLACLFAVLLCGVTWLFEASHILLGVWVIWLVVLLVCGVSRSLEG